MMNLDYCVFVDSPFTCLGGHRLLALVAQHNVHVRIKPIRYRDVFAATGNRGQSTAS
jgi:2-hydroxychromene-2-carboxylate isomerase